MIELYLKNDFNASNIKLNLYQDTMIRMLQI